jgi:hypothetical protein
VGQQKSTSARSGRTRLRRLRRRRCLRKGCDHTYQPRRWNQRYCQDPECQRELRRWQAAKRQQRHRDSEPVRAKHAAAERERRRQAKSRSKPVEEVAGDLARGHAAKDFSLAPCCDRPGCYAPRRWSIRNPASYCSDTCRLTLARVQDRERKWLCRATVAGQQKRRLEYKNARSRKGFQAHPATYTRGPAAIARPDNPRSG